MISREDYEFITKLDNANPEQRKIICTDHAPQCALTFLNLLGYISKDATLQYILTMIDDLIEEDPTRSVSTTVESGLKYLIAYF